MTSSLTCSPVLPRVQSVPTGGTEFGEAAVKLAAQAGLILDDWQQVALVGGCRTRPDRTWAAREVCVLVARQNGKGAITEARELAGLFLFGERLILHSAHEFKTAKNAFERIRDTIRATPHLAERVKQWRYSNEEVSIELHNGQKLRFVARSSGSGRGFSADCVVLDESYELPDAALGALMPTLSARPNPQIWYTSTPPTPTSNGEVLTRVRDRGRAGTSSRLAYFEWSADPDGLMPDDRGAWLQANPALGIRLTDESIEAEREAMSEVDFVRERLGVWADARPQGVIDMAQWHRLADPESKPGEPKCFAVAVPPDRSKATISVVAGRSDGAVHVEVVASEKDTGWVAGRLAELVEKWQPCAVVLDPGGPSGGILAAVEAAGVEVAKVTAREYAQACAAFYDAVRDGRVRHRADPLLTSAVDAGRKRPLGDAWAWNRRDGGSDITPLEAATLALHGFDVHGRVKPKSSRVYFFGG